ncbi:LLM class flavin-dependent oxidoreductase [Actinoallomurus purpureus]|uniref:LLM class flavin-dependent oxidoreductase n=1 Tax=Actinoallomurus purpureus TaxID=478114 RepID=UPI0020929F46|nr:LLM class flavin-dependent oxidoreductase [Actinoallomurus purpureus]MCO6005229.1 LLM class flavin-dependent oxidoreductase [Actinoallomurus purpureus]
MRVGIRLPPCRPADEMADAARRAEDLGFDDVWIPDSQTLWRDAYVTLACAALRTTRVRLGTAVTNLVTRHPSVVAAAARTVAELAPDRFVLGVGVGNSSVEPIGLRSSTTAELRAGVAALRDATPGVPVHVAASGPRNLAVGGELGDGVILLAGASVPLVEAALATVGAHGAPAEVTVSAFCQVTDDLERDARALKPVCAAMAQKGGAGALAAAGIDVEVPRRVPEVTPDLLHAEDWAHAVEVCSAWVSDADAVRFAREFCLYGTAVEIADRMAGLERLGVTGVLLQHVGSYTLPHELMESLGKVLA